MNIYKKKRIIDHILKNGRLPTDQFGQILSPEELLAWFRLDERLSEYEQAVIKVELMQMIEAESLMDKRRMDEDRGTME